MPVTHEEKAVWCLDLLEVAHSRSVRMGLGKEREPTSAQDHYCLYAHNAKVD